MFYFCASWTALDCRPRRLWSSAGPVPLSAWHAAPPRPPGAALSTCVHIFSMHRFSGELFAAMTTTISLQVCLQVWKDCSPYTGGDVGSSGAHMYLVKPLSGSSWTARCSTFTASSCCPTSACTTPRASRYSTFCGEKFIIYVKALQPETAFLMSRRREVEGLERNSHLWLGITGLLEMPYGCLKVIVLQRGLGGIKVL